MKCDCSTAIDHEGNNDNPGLTVWQTGRLRALMETWRRFDSMAEACALWVPGMRRLAEAQAETDLPRAVAGVITMFENSREFKTHGGGGFPSWIAASVAKL